MQLAFAGVELGHFDQVGHQVVQFLRLVARRGHQLGLQRLQLAAESLAERIEPASQLQQRIAQLAAGDGDKLGLEAVGVLQLVTSSSVVTVPSRRPSESRIGVVRKR